MPESISIDPYNPIKIEQLMLELNVLKTDRVLFIGSNYLVLCLHLCKDGYEKLYFIDDKKDIYNYPCYTNIRYFYQKDGKLHFPHHFFKVIIVSDSYSKKSLTDFIYSNGIIIVGNLVSNDKTPAQHLDSKVEKIQEVQILMENNSTLFAKKNSTLSKFQVLKVRTSQVENIVPKKLDILCYSGREEGIYIHSKILKERLETEYGMFVNLTDNVRSAQSSLVVVEYHPGSGHFDRLHEDIILLLNGNANVILENHGSLRNFSEPLKKLIDKGLIVTYRSPEIAEQDHIEKYYILPVLTYKNINIPKPVEINEIRIGTFGFIGKQKGTEDIISLALRLKVHAELLLGVSPTDPDAEKKIMDFKGKYGKRKNISIKIYKKQISYYENGLVNVFIGNHTDKDIIDAMSGCSHIAFAHRTRMEESGTIKYAKRLAKPIFALDSYQARIGQVRRFSKFTSLTPFRIIKDGVIEEVLSFSRGQQRFGKLVNVIACIFVRQIKVVFHGESPHTRNLKEMQTTVIRDDDGLDYLVAIMSKER